MQCRCSGKLCAAPGLVGVRWWRCRSGGDGRGSGSGGGGDLLRDRFILDSGQSPCDMSASAICQAAEKRERVRQGGGGGITPCSFSTTTFHLF